MLNKTIWSELWRRAEREEIGVLIRFTNGNEAKFNLQRERPLGFSDYAICRTPDPNTLMIIRPGVNLNEASDNHALREILGDLE